MSRPRSRAPITARRWHGPDAEAARLGVSPSLILEGCRMGTYPHRRCGRRILIDPAEADAVLAATGISAEQAIAKTIAWTATTAQRGDV